MRRAAKMNRVGFFFLRRGELCDLASSSIAGARPAAWVGWLAGRIAVALAACGWLVMSAPAQRDPHMGYLFPAGGQQGTSFNVLVGGQFLNTADEVLVSGSGVEATVLDYERPVAQKQVNDAREKLQEVRQVMEAARRKGEIPGPGDAMRLFVKLAEERGYSVEDLAKFAEYRCQRSDPKRQLNPQIAEQVRLRVTVAPDAKPGVRELRLGTRTGLSNPMAFCISQLPEFQEPAERISFSWEQLGGFRSGNVKPDAAAPGSRRVPLPVVINGQILPGEVDQYQFAARKGQPIVVSVSARALIPYLADAVPGWFQATVALLDAQGQEVAYADDFRFHPDPVLRYEIPRDGEYTLQIKDSIYRGREDFVYRISLGELPFVTGIFPLGGRTGEVTRIAFTGWNLDQASVAFDGSDKLPGLYPLQVGAGKLLAEPVSFVLDDLAEVLEEEPNNRRAGARRLEGSTLVNGRIESAGDRDVFQFEGQAGREIVLEVSARRLNSPLDSILKVTDGQGRQLAFNDDHQDQASGLTTHHADSYLAFTPPADGVYYVEIGDAQNSGGPAYGYRLRVSPPRPDFELRLVPSSLLMAPGTTLPITVHAVRKDGFAGDIDLDLAAAPDGFVLGGNRVPAGQDQVRITLTAPGTAAQESASLHLVGRATVAGRELVRPVIPAEDMMQAFFYRHLVPAEELKVAVRGPARRVAPVRILGESPVAIPAGGTASVRLTHPGRSFAGNLELELDQPPEGIRIQEVISDRTTTTLVLETEAAKVQPGLKGNLIVTAYGRSTPKPGQANTNPRRYAIGTLPAIPFEVLPQP